MDVVHAKVIRKAIGFVFLSVLISCHHHYDDKPVAIAGVLDLGQTDLVLGNQKLDGEWLFYKDTFVDPVNPTGEADGNIQVPKVWNDQIIMKQKLGGSGFGTYRLKVLLARNLPKTQLAIKMLEVGSAYSLYVNGTLVGKNGQVAQKSLESVPQFLTGIYTFQTIQTNQSELDIVIHVSNFENKWGGIWHPVVLGTDAHIRELREHHLLYEFVLFGVLIALGIYHLSFFFSHSHEKSTIYFSLFCLCIAVRVLLTGERYFIQLYPDFNWEWAYKLEYLSFYLGVPAWAAFLHALYHEQTHRHFMKLTLAFSSLFVCSVLFFPVIIYADFLIAFQLYTLLLGIYSIYVLLRATLQGHLGAKTFLTGWILLFSAVIIDIVAAQGLIQTINLVPYGVLIFILSQSLVISRRFSRAFKIEESLARELEKRVLDRTRELAMAKEDAESSNQAKTQFLSTMSHELRTPMHAIVGIADLLGEHRLDEQTQGYIRMLKRSGMRMMRMINEILDMSKIEAGRLELQNTIFSFREMINHCTAPMKINAMAKDLKLMIIIDAKIPDKLYGDEEKLEKIILNILGNAIKFTDKGQVKMEITLGQIDANDLSVYFRIIDTGPGISPQSIPKLFQPFTQVDASSTRRHDGTGLGLVISKSLVELMGGTIDYSTGSAGGSIFFFYVQLKKSDIEQPQAEPMAPGSNSLPLERPDKEGDATKDMRKGLKILLAEDNLDNVKLIELYFKDQDIDLTVVGNGNAAVEAVRLQRFDLIIMDIRMPVMDGLEATKAIRDWESDHHKERLPILALSANAAPSDIEQSLLAGCTAHIAKPVLKKELIAAIIKMT